MSTSLRGPTGRDRRELHQRVERWVAASLITEAEARSIERFESERVPVPMRRPLAVEALAYLGGALALSAGAVAVAEVWDDLAPGMRVALPATGTLVFVASGWWLRRSADPAIGRLVGVLWGLAVLLAHTVGATTARDVMELGERVSTAVGGATATALALALYAVRRRALQQLAVLAGLALTLNQAVSDDSSLAHALLTIAIGAAWALLGWRGLVVPARVALVAGSAVAMFAAILPGDDERAIAVVPAIVVAVAIVVASVALRDGAVLAIGILGLFRASFWSISRLFSGTIAMPIALLVAGAIAFAAAVVLARRVSTAERPPSNGGRGQDVPL
jgi:hypothetical protein